MSGEWAGSIESGAARPRIHDGQRLHGHRVYLPRRQAAVEFRRHVLDKNRIDGAAKEIKGATKEAFGKVTGNTGKQVAGLAEKKIGTAQRKMGEAGDKARSEAR